MALQGTLDTFSLPDVLRLLATTGKSGCLHIEGDRGRGSVWLEDGAVVGASAERALKASPIDEVVFEMLRFGRGSFSFAADEEAPDNGQQPKDVEATLRKATQLLDEWRDLERVVPSLSHRVAMAPELTVEQVTIDASRWEALVAIAGGRSVSELGEILKLGELSVSRAVSDLVELGVAVIEPPGAARAPSASSSRRGNSDSPRRSPKSDAGPSMRETTKVSASAPAASLSSGEVPRTTTWPRTLETPVTATTSKGSPAPGGSSKDLNGQVETAPKTRARQTPARPPRPRRTGPAPTSQASSNRTAPSSLRNGNGNGNGLANGNGNGHGNGQALVQAPVPPPAPPAPMLPPSLDRGLHQPPTMPTSALPEPGQGLMLPPSLDTGRLGPSPIPMDTGQIPAVAASALPPDLSWAADDGEPTQAVSPLAPGAMPGSSVFRSAPGGRLSTPPPPPVTNGRVQTNGRDGDTAPHVAALSPEARNAVEATIGRSGGGPGGMPLAGADPVQAQSRTQLMHFLSSVRQ